VKLGRGKATLSVFIMTLASYVMITTAVIGKLLPISALLVLLTVPLFIVQTKLYRTPGESPLHYVKLTQTTLALSTVFGLLLSLSLLLG
jgi:1,4-dihydroxy-2-naphthoate octaprenyltransferase